MMKITSVRVFKIEEPKGRVKGFASIVLEDAFAVHGLQIVEGKDRMFVSMPSRKNKEDKFVNIAHPINTELRQAIEEAVLREFE